MKLAFKHKPKLTNLQKEIIEELSYHTTKLYNIVNYDMREKEYQSYFDNEKEYKSNWHCDFLHSHNRQHCLRVLEKNWKSYFSAKKDYKNNPSKYKGEPRPPKFKNHNNRKNEIIFTKAAIRFRDNTLILSLVKATQKLFNVKSLDFEVSDKLQSVVNFESAQQVKIKWNNVSKYWEIIIIYKQEEQEKAEGSNIMSIDLGLNNLATITFSESEKTYIIDGKSIKSKNSYFNKEISRLQSVKMSQIGSDKFKDTKNIARLRVKRNNFVKDYLHKASKKVVDLAIKHNVGEIVIGDIKDIKRNKKRNKHFVQVPLVKFVEYVEYKAQLKGISVSKVKENYTSGVSAIDLEPICKESYDKRRRIKRGLFVSGLGPINSDVNGSLNILRKYINSKCIPRPIQLARGNGFLDNPKRIRIA